MMPRELFLGKRFLVEIREFNGRELPAKLASLAAGQESSLLHWDKARLSFLVLTLL